MSMVLLIAGVDVVIWLVLLLARGGFWRAKCDDNVQVPVSADWPEITVIIPARNEADILGETLPSLLNTDYPKALRIILVDDRSEDDTALVAGNIAAAHQAQERLTVINGRALPAGWKGKVWAMQCGLEQAFAVDAPRYILFTDADIAYDKGALMQLVAQAEAGNLALASLMVRLRCTSLAERFLIPPFVYFFQLLYPFTWVNQRQRKLAAAAGGCMLVRADILQQAGGLTPIRHALIDDCALARLLKPHGRISLGLTQGVHSLRAYPQIADIHAMVARSAYDQLGYSPLNLALATVGMAMVYLAPPLLTFFSGGLPQLFGAGCWLLMAISYLPILRFYRRPFWQSLTLPLMALCYMAFTLDSARQYKNGRGGFWKGRVQAAPAVA